MIRLVILLLAVTVLAPHTTTASDGGPIATCRPGANCKPNDQVR